MRKAGEMLVGTQDFTSLTNTDAEGVNHVKTVYSVDPLIVSEEGSMSGLKIDLMVKGIINTYSA